MFALEHLERCKYTFKTLQCERENGEHLKYARNVISVQSHVRNPLTKRQSVNCCLIFVENVHSSQRLGLPSTLIR